MLFVQFLLIGWVESKRWADLKNPGSQGDGSFLGVTDELKVNAGQPHSQEACTLTMAAAPPNKVPAAPCHHVCHSSAAAHGQELL